MTNGRPALWQDQQGSEGNELDIMPMLMSLYRYKWAILAVALLSGLIAFLYANTLVPVYQASATLLIEENDSSIVSIQDVYGGGYRGYEYRETQYQLLKSRSLAERVVRKLELHKDRRFPLPELADPAPARASWLPDWVDLSFLKPAHQVAREEAVQRVPSMEEREEAHIASLTGMVAGGFTVTPVRDSHIVSISYRSADAELAALLVNTLADQYIESYLDARLGATRRASEWLSERLGGLRENLVLAEGRLQEYTDREELVDLEGITTLGARQIADLTSRYNEARAQRANAENIRRDVQRLGTATTAQYLTLPAVQQHEVIRSLRQMQADAQRRVNELSQRYGVKHPRMIAAVSELQSIQGDLSAEVDKVIFGIDSEYQLALRTEQSLYTQLEAAKEEFRDVNRKNFELGELQREVETNRQLYDMFFTRMQETTQAGDFEKANARIIDNAEVPKGAVSPNKRMIMLVGLMGGLLLSSGIAVLLGILDNTVKIPEEVEKKLNASLLGVLPLQKAGKDGSFEGYWQNPKSLYAEAVRTVRTSVVLSGLDNPHKIILVTSSLPEEGKSAVALNLGAAFAQMEKTLVIGADLRRPTLAAKCGLPGRHPGLSNYVAGSAELDECISQFGQEQLFVMPAGLIPTNPLEMLSSRRFREVLDALSERFDRIIIDSAPVHAVSDALILATYSDTLIYVVSADSTSATLARRGLERLATSNTPIAGVILNRFDTEKAAKYYGSGFYGYQAYYQEQDDEAAGRR